jgi:hypothetical protein
MIIGVRAIKFDQHQIWTEPPSTGANLTKPASNFANPQKRLKKLARRFPPSLIGIKALAPVYMSIVYH